MNGAQIISRVPEQNGVSQASYVVDIHHSGREPSRGILLFGDPGNRTHNHVLWPTDEKPLSPLYHRVCSHRANYLRVLRGATRVVARDGDPECIVCLLVGCLTSQQHASVSQGRICSHICTCCLTEKEIADPSFHLTHSQYTDTGPINPITDSTTPGAWQGGHWSANF